LGHHPGLLGYDILNEPAPGSAAQEIFATVLHVFASATGQSFEQLLADFSAPATKFSQLSHLENTDVHRTIGDHAAPLLERFETDYVHPFMVKIARAIRDAGGTGILAREHNYFANL